VSDKPEPPDLVIGKHGDDALAVQWRGDPEGRPVLLMHGMPGSRLGPWPRSIVLERMGIWLISYDRPGYGQSTRKPGRTVAQAADDVERIADRLDLDSFAIVGRSGGGPHALACAALLEKRVERVALLVSFAPPDALGLTWDDGMASVNVEDYADVDGSVAAAAAEEFAETASLRTRAALMKDDPEALVRHLLPELTRADRRFVEDRAMRNLLLETYAEAVLQGADGWIDDAVALRTSWDFKFDDVTCPVLLWHGGDDRFAPAAHTRWIAEQLRNARDGDEEKAEIQLRIERDAAHFAAFEIFPEVLSWLVAPAVHPTLALPRTAAGLAVDGFVFRPAALARSGVLG
jgi:pimeloyl-ACP methyl ester carboxylesterase